MTKLKQLVACAAMAVMPMSASASDYNATLCWNVAVDGGGPVFLQLDARLINTSFALNGAAFAGGVIAPATGTAFWTPDGIHVGLSLDYAFAPLVVELLLADPSLDGSGLAVLTDYSDSIGLTATQVPCGAMTVEPSSPPGAAGLGLLD